MGPFTTSPGLASAPLYKPPPSGKLVNLGPTPEQLAREKKAKLEEEARLQAELEKVELRIRKAEEAKQLKEERKKRASDPDERKRREAIREQRKREAEEQKIQHDLEEFRKAKERELNQKARFEPTPNEKKSAKSGKSSKAAIKIQALVRGFLVRRRYAWLRKLIKKQKDLNERLRSVQAKTEKDLSAMREKVETYKRELDERARAKREKMNAKQELAEATRVEVETLKAENAQYREKGEKLKNNCRNLRINNLRLEKSNAGQEEYVRNLKEHHARCLKDNARLVGVEEEYSKKVEELTDSLVVRTAYAVMENRTKVRFRNGVKIFMRKVEKCDNVDVALKMKLLKFFEKCEKFEKDAGEPIPFEIPEEIKKKLTEIKTFKDDDSDSSFWDSPQSQGKPKAKLDDMGGAGPPLGDDDDDDENQQKNVAAADKKSPIKKNGTKKAVATRSNAVDKNPMSPRVTSKEKKKAQPVNDDSSSSSSDSSDSDVGCKPAKKEPVVKITKPKNRNEKGKKESTKLPKSPTAAKKGNVATTTKKERPDGDNSESSTDKANRSPIKHTSSMLNAATKLSGGSPPKPPLAEKQGQVDSDSDGWSSGDSDSDTQ